MGDGIVTTSCAFSQMNGKQITNGVVKQKRRVAPLRKFLPSVLLVFISVLSAASPEAWHAEMQQGIASAGK